MGRSNKPGMKDLAEDEEDNKTRFQRFKSRVKKIVKSNYFDYFLIFIIVMSSIHLILDNPLNNPDGKLSNSIKYLDIILLITKL